MDCIYLLDKNLYICHPPKLHNTPVENHLVVMTRIIECLNLSCDRVVKTGSPGNDHYKHMSRITVGVADLRN